MSKVNSLVRAYANFASLVTGHQGFRVCVLVGDRGILMDLKGDGVPGLMEKLKLSGHEKKGIKIGGAKVVIRRRGKPQAVAKVMAKKPVRADALELSLGRVWCPLKGVECKDLGRTSSFSHFSKDRGRRGLWKMVLGCLARIW